MGIDVTAYVAFGFDLGCAEDDEFPAVLQPPEDSDGDDDPVEKIESMIAEDAGIRAPGDASADGAWKAYWRAKNDAVDRHVCEPRSHGYDYDSVFVAVRGTIRRCDAGESIALGDPVDLPRISPSKIEELKRFCHVHSIPWKRPQWYLFTSFSC